MYLKIFNVIFLSVVMRLENKKKEIDREDK